MQIRKYRASDFKELRSWIPNARFMFQWGGRGLKYPLTTQQLEERFSDPRIHAYALEINGLVVGYGEIAERPARDGRICRVIIKKSSRGKGLGKHLSKELSNIAFKKLGLNRVTLNVFDFNQSAINCYKSIGFREYKKTIGAREFQGEPWNMLYMELPKT